MKIATVKFNNITPKTLFSEYAKYGIVPILCVLKKCEETEDYENAQVVFNFIEELNNKFTDINFECSPDKIDTEIEDALAKFREHGYSGYTYITNLPSYIDDVFKQLT